MNELPNLPKQLQEATVNELTHEKLKSLVAYEPDSGLFTTASVPWHSRAIIGRVLGTCDGAGYLRIKLNGAFYRLHRLAWFYVYGDWPNGVIDHINGICSDNRISNLRDVPRITNSQNVKKARLNNMSGLLGVTSPKGTERLYRAYIKTNGIRTALGAFETANQAHEAYVNAKRRLHAGCTI